MMVFTSLVFLFLASFFTNSDPKIVVTWGEPKNFLEFQTGTKSETYWADCIDECLKNELCVLIADTGSTCQSFYKGNITDVVLLESGSGKRVGFKRTMDTCPKSGEPPLFGEVSVNEPTYILNNLKTENSVQFSIRCADDSLLSIRGSVSVCITPRVFADPYFGNYANAQMLCAVRNGLGLTGPYSESEELLIRNLCNQTLKCVADITPGTVKNKTNDFWADGICGSGTPAECVFADPLIEGSSRYSVMKKYREDNVFCAFMSVIGAGAYLAGCNQTSADEPSGLMRGAICLTKPL